MKECKEKAILPCYRDDTHEKVYELNKQMCDIGKTLSNPLGSLSEETIQEIAKALEITRNPKDIMEEKKTKKMTKAEAFEYLKGKKVYVNSHSAHIQATLFEAGYAWSSGSRNIDNEDMPFLLTTNHGEFFTICNMREFAKVDYEEISVDDILSIEIVEEKNGEEAALDLISVVGARLSKVLRDMEGHKHVVITKDDVILYEEGMCLFHSDPF